jgi:hypothetical protein
MFLKSLRRNLLCKIVIHFEREHPNASLNLFPHPQPLSHLWEKRLGNEGYQGFYTFGMLPFERASPKYVIKLT